MNECGGAAQPPGTSSGDLETIRQMEHIVAKMVGKRLMYRDLVAHRADGWRPLYVTSTSSKTSTSMS